MGGGALHSHMLVDAFVTIICVLALRFQVKGGGAVTFGGEGTAMNQSQGMELKLYSHLTNYDGKFHIF